MTSATGAGIELDIDGMTCASCAVRIEKRLNRIEGVSASVNYATEKARVLVPAGFDANTLLEEVAGSGYRASLPVNPKAQRAVRDAETSALRRRLVTAAVLTAPVAALSMIPALQFASWGWVALVLTVPVVFWAGWPFHRAAAVNLRHAAVTMDTLISLGTLAAFSWSLYALIAGIGDPHAMPHVYLEVAAGVTAFVLAGKYVERRSKRKAGAALRALMALGAKDVAVVRAGSETRIAIDDLRVGDEFVVRPGESIATDGVVVSGASAVDRSVLTGESVPVEVSAGDAVTGASMNTSGRLVVRATRIGSDTQLARIARLVEDAQSGKAAVQRLADRISAVFVPAVLVIALVTLAAWLLMGSAADSAFTAAVAVLIIACPCALGLATPTALLVGSGRGAQLGVLIRGPEVLESTRRVDTVVLDKTGTVTAGRMTLAGAVGVDGVEPAEVIRVAGAVEHASEHPIGRAVAEAASDAFGTLPEVEGFRSVAGRGVTGVVEGRTAFVGRHLGVPASMPSTLAAAERAAEDDGLTPVLVGWDGEIKGLLLVSDTVKPTSREAVRRLAALGLEPILLTGDNAATARRVASEVDIDTVIAEVLPEEKVDVVRRLQADGKVVAMIGDGVNDAAALAQADLGIAIGSGADAAIEASDLTLVGGDLRSAVDAVRLSRRTSRTIHTNLFWAFAYNTAAIPLAAFGLLDPMLAGAAMALSSIFVVGNSLLLRSFRSVTEGRS